jgi:hypothetical protein
MSVLHLIGEDCGVRRWTMDSTSSLFRPIALLKCKDVRYSDKT